MSAALTLRLDGQLVAADDSGGFDVRETDEDAAVDLFRAWFRDERARLDREALATARRARLRLVPTTAHEVRQCPDTPH